MLDARHISFTAASAAKVLLGTLLFLVLASYLALPCMVRDASQFQSMGAPNSCSEHDIFKPAADLNRLFTSLTAETPFRLPVLALVLAAPFLTLLLFRPLGHQRLKRRRLRRRASLPFSSEDPPKLPAFAALRDA